ncbi:MAG: LysM peptidoglycan-binding domain-containing protein, partial [Verrucomicrobia bacterium]|nr:LysM peptidoglycan-binding domain-containing protein [Verrucomicrobiota bacterium]
GCETRRPTAEQSAPPAPPLPPRPDSLPPPASKPVFQPPVPVEPAPAAIEPGSGRLYEVQNGESLSKIASRFGVSTRELVELNKIKDPNHIRAGQKIVLPEYASSQPQAPSKPKAKAKAAAAEGAEGYTVQAGDSLSKIAVKHGTTVSALREANNLTGDKILVGQKLVIPGGKAAKKDKAKEKEPEKKAEESVPATEPTVAPPPPEAPVVESSPRLGGEEQPMDYVVQPGDTIESIAKMYIIRKEQIMQLNNLSEGAELKPGQKIKVPTM